jgi:hypothetical protein
MSARRISDPHNPGIAALIFRAGLAEYVQRKYGKDNRRMVEQRRAARVLCEAGIIDYDQSCDLRRKIDRRAVAGTLRNLRKSEPFAVRAAVISRIRAQVPIGMSRDMVRMGKTARA